MEIDILTHEFWSEPVEQTQHVMGHEDLTITASASTNTDCRYCELLRDDLRQAGGNGLENQTETADLFKQDGILKQSSG